MMDLRAYEQNKFAIAEILRGASRLVPEVERESRSRLQELLARLAEDRFNLVVVGRFSRGKTSLMNAILGSDRLPTGLAPLTSVVTTVTYGSTEQVILKFRNRILYQEIPISALPEYITQEGNPGNVKGIAVAEVQLPAEILRRGFYFVDTPGLGSVIRENTLTTEAFLPEADAFILVTSYDSPLSEEELRFFKAGSSSGRRIFVVLNKQDLVSSDQRESVFSFVERQLRGIFGRVRPQIFSVSSTDAQKAKRERNVAGLTASGIPKLEKELVQFLLTEKQTQFLQQMCQRVQQRLQQLPNSTEASQLKSRFQVFSDQFGAGVNAPREEASGNLDDEFSSVHRAQPCEICTEIDKVIWEFICKYQYRITATREEQDRFAMRGGFCPFHTWEYRSVACSYGACNAYPGLLDRLSGELRTAAARANATREMLAGALRNSLPTPHDCALCAARERAERDAVIRTASRLDREEGILTPAVCLPHLVMVVSEIQNGQARRYLVEQEAAVFQRLSEDMRRFTLKQDAARRYMTSAEETAAAEQGLAAVAGLPRTNFVPRMRGVPRCEEVLAPTVGYSGAPINAPKC